MRETLYFIGEGNRKKYKEYDSAAFHFINNNIHRDNDERLWFPLEITNKHFYSDLHIRLFGLYYRHHFIGQGSPRASYLINTS